MATGGTSARAPARALIGKTRPPAEMAALRKLERILDARALGHKADRIAYDLRLVKAQVVRLIAARRAAGDARALTDKQAVAAAEERQARKEQERAARSAPKASAEAVAALDALIEERRASERSRESDKRAAWVARLRHFAAVYRPHTAVSASFLHLADLHEHCEHFYPNKPIPSEGATLESTRRMFPPASCVAYGGGSGAACAEG
jgi:hypothetical protein